MFLANATSFLHSTSRIVFPLAFANEPQISLEPGCYCIQGHLGLYSWLSRPIATETDQSCFLVDSCPRTVFMRFAVEPPQGIAFYALGWKRRILRLHPGEYIWFDKL